MSVPKSSRNLVLASTIIATCASVGLGFVSQFTEEPRWLADHPMIVKAALPIFLLLLLTFAAIPIAVGGDGADIKSDSGRWWSRRVRRNARLAQCLACGQKRW